jgi:hypothetical protein
MVCLGLVPGALELADLNFIVAGGGLFLRDKDGGKHQGGGHDA